MFDALVADVLALAAAHHPITPPTTASPWLYILGAILAGGVLEFVWRIFQRVRYGGRDDAMSIAKAAQYQAANASELWVKYKVELEDAQKQIGQYLEELIKVNRELGAASARIAKLEDDLREERSESARLRDELAEARAKRDELLDKVHALHERIRALES